MVVLETNQKVYKKLSKNQKFDILRAVFLCI